MKKNLIAVLIFFFLAFNIYSQNSKNRFQWQFSKILADEEKGDIYDIYIYDSKLDETNYVMTLWNNLYPLLKNENTIVHNGKESFSTVWSWYAGGGIGCSAFYENGELRVYQACFEERQEPFLDSEKILYKTACALSDCSITEGVFLPTPEYTRELKKEKINMYGADIMFLQSVLVNLYGLNIDIDGYFGKQTLAAVKLVQKRLGFAETGIVDKHFWESVVIQHQ